MSDKPKPADSEQPWRPYAPSKETPWDMRRVLHLHHQNPLPHASPSTAA